MLGSLSLTSCGSDEPETNGIVYYIEIEEEFLVDGSVNHTDRYKNHNPITMLREAIQNVYPEPNSVGSDEAVIMACDEVYARFYEMYTGKENHLTCVVNLIKGRMESGIIRQSELLKTYNFDVNPIEESGD